MFDIKGWVIYAVYIAFHFIKTIFEIITLKSRINGVSEEIIFYRRVSRQDNIKSLRPKKKNAL